MEIIGTTEELQDSTDWNGTALSALEQVEAALRCQVCKEFYDTPMTTSCAHTFCSLCIHRFLNDKGICPICNTKDQEVKLRSNLAMGETVAAFRHARQQALNLARTIRDERASTGSGKRTRVVAAGRKDESPAKRRRAAGRTTRSSTQQSATIPDSDHDDDDDYTEEEPSDGLTACPICQGRMSEEEVIKHLDKCTGIPPRSKPLPAKVTPVLPLITPKPSAKPSTLAHPHYGSLKDGPLRKKLTDQGLRADGSRKLLEKRYTEFVIAHNANCDSMKPKGKAELRAYMAKWEKAQAGQDKEGALIASKEFDGKAWANTHEDSFKNLAAQARSKLAAKRQEQLLAAAQPEQPTIKTAPLPAAVETAIPPSHTPDLETYQDKTRSTSPPPPPPTSAYLRDASTAYGQSKLVSTPPPPTDQFCENTVQQSLSMDGKPTQSAYQQYVASSQNTPHTHSFPLPNISPTTDEYDYDPPPSSQLQFTPTRTTPNQHGQ